LTVAPKGRIEVEGVSEVTGAFAELASDTRDVKSPSEELGRRGLEATLRVVPILSGTLAGGITFETSERGVELGSPEPYAAFPEYGTRWQIAQRYLGAGFDEMSADAPEVYNRWLEDQLKANGG
jgi:hypothetical protein